MRANVTTGFYRVGSARAPAWHWPIVSASRSSRTHRKLLPATGSLIHPARSFQVIIPFCGFSHRVLQITQRSKSASRPAWHSRSPARASLANVKRGVSPIPFIIEVCPTSVLRNIPVRSRIGVYRNYRRAFTLPNKFCQFCRKSSSWLSTWSDFKNFISLYLIVKLITAIFGRLGACN